MNLRMVLGNPPRNLLCGPLAPTAMWSTNSHVVPLHQQPCGQLSHVVLLHQQSCGPLAPTVMWYPCTNSHVVPLHQQPLTYPMDLIKTRLQIQGELAAVQEGLSSEQLLFHSSSSSFRPHEAELTPFQTASQKIWKRRGSKSGPLNL
uniref:Uncharacterized protein n=1 Tax=Timema bartmani TaxID=61472 RepID=A0A7R9EZD6_9NEOP|nr:unnamed protein product [Timema bartmani]